LPAGECAFDVTEGADHNLWFQDGPNLFSTEAIGVLVIR
jgi:hypothetical protein